MLYLGLSPYFFFECRVFLVKEKLLYDCCSAPRALFWAFHQLQFDKQLPPPAPPKVGKQARPGAVLKYRQGMFGTEGSGFTKSKLKFISTDAVNVRPLESFKPSERSHICLNPTPELSSGPQWPVARRGSLCFPKDSQSRYLLLIPVLCSKINDTNHHK